MVVGREGGQKYKKKTISTNKEMESEERKYLSFFPGDPNPGSKEKVGGRG